MYIYSADHKSLIKRTENPFVKNTIKDIHHISHFSPLWGNQWVVGGNTNFTAGSNDGGLKIWAEKDIAKVGDLYVEGILLTFKELSSKYQIHTKLFFKYLQLKHFISSKYKNINSEPPLSNLEHLTLLHFRGRVQISLSYSLLLSHDAESSTDRLEAWISEIKETISKEEWNEACLKAQIQTVNGKMRLLQYKWLMRTYITPVKLNS